MRMNLGLATSVVGSVQQRLEKILISQDLENEKESRLKLRWLKEVIKEYDNTNNLNIIIRIINHV